MKGRRGEHKKFVIRRRKSFLNLFHIVLIVVKAVGDVDLSTYKPPVNDEILNIKAPTK